MRGANRKLALAVLAAVVVVGMMGAVVHAQCYTGDVQVSGSGTHYIHGTWTPTGQISWGQPRFRLDGLYDMYWSGMNWYVVGDYGTVIYMTPHNDPNNPFPPDTGWIAVNNAPLPVPRFTPITMQCPRSVTVTPSSGLTTTEAGGTATFTVVLGSQPTDSVTIGISSDDTTEGTVQPASLTFTTGDWATPQTVTVTGVDDDVDDGNVAYHIVTAPATGGDYAGLNASDVTVTNSNDDVRGITVTPTAGLTTTEQGGTATFTVALDSEPTDTVTIGIASDDLGEGTALPGTLTFTADDWTTPQTVTVTGVADDVDDEDVTYNIVTAPATGGDYEGVNASDVSVTNGGDDDVRGITVTPTTALSTTEQGGTATFTVVLDSEPTDTVAIGISSDDTTEGTVLPASITFDAGDWNTPQTVTVTGADDYVEDGDVGYSVVTAVASGGDYAGLDASDVSVTNGGDDDVRGITVSPTTGLTTTEAGTTANFTVVLNSQPTDSVTIGITSDDTSEGTVLPASITFDAGNWNTPQTVTVTGVDDPHVDGDIDYMIVTAPATGGDYAGIDAADVSASNSNDDVRGITVTPTTGLITTEQGGTATFTVVLGSEPTASVTIGISSDDTSEGTVLPASLIFDAGTWDTPQTVTVTGIDDPRADGDIDYMIVTAPAAGGDYTEVDAADVSLSNTDDDVCGITVTPTTGLTTTEAGTTAIFTVVLNSQPTDSVTIGISSDDTTEGTVLPASLTFDAGNWDTPQTVTVTGVDDDVDDGNVGYSIVTATATGGDYVGIDAADVSVTNGGDDDVRGITVELTSSMYTTEAGDTATITVVLDSEPTEPVTIGISSSDTTQGTVQPASLTFTLANWSMPQTLTATGVDDPFDDGNGNYMIVTSVATGGDYAGINAADVFLCNQDDDTRGLVVTPASVMTTTEGGTSTFTVALGTPPTDSVSLYIRSQDYTEGTNDPISFEFTTDNWAIPQTVTVTGVDDDIQDGDRSYYLATSIGGGDYSGLDIPDIRVVNMDDDVAGIIFSSTDGLTTTEAGGTDSFTVVLTTDPDDWVRIMFSGDTTEGTGRPTNSYGASTFLGPVFDAFNWRIPQTVTIVGVDDGIDDGNVTYDLSVEVVGGDGYDGMEIADINVTNIDDDVRGITVSPAGGLITTEAGATAFFTVVLDSQPTDTAVFLISSDDLTEGRALPGSLTFTPDNWNAPQTVTVIGADDEEDDGEVTYNITAEIHGSDYAATDAFSVTVTNSDDDVPGFTVTQSGDLTTTEAGASGTFSVVLDSQPTAPVTIGILSDDPTEGTALPAALIFTPDDWATPQTVTVTGTDDEIDDGSIEYSIIIGGLSTVAVTNTDDDTRGIVVTPSSGLLTTEAGGTDSFAVALRSQPTYPLQIAVTSGDMEEATVSVETLTFDSGNWDTPQEVIVIGVDDSFQDGDTSFPIDLDPMDGHSDYANLPTHHASATNIDDDIRGIIVSPTAGLITSEAGDTATFTVALATQPITDAYLVISSDDTTEGLVSPYFLLFSDDDWANPKTVTVTGLDDRETDSSIAYTILITPADGWGDYDDVAGVGVNVTNLDNDLPPPPTISCSDPVSVNTDPGKNYATEVDLGTSTVSGGSGVATISNDAPAQFPLGDTTITWTAVDEAGQTGTCTQIVTVMDNEAPVLVLPPDTTIDCAGSRHSAVTGAATATDACTPSPTLTYSDSLLEWPNNWFWRTWSAVDTAGNSATGKQRISVIGPAIDGLSWSHRWISSLPQSVEASFSTDGCATQGDVCVWNDQMFQFGQVVDIVSDGTTINTASVEFEAGWPEGTYDARITLHLPAPLDGWIPYYYTQQFIVDLTPPIITCPGPVSVGTDRGECFATGVSFGTVTATDNLGTVTVSSDAPQRFPLGDTTVTWTAEDEAGHTASCTQIVTVIDNEAPTLKFTDVPSNPSSEGDGTIKWQASDNCPSSELRYTIALDGLLRSGGWTRQEYRYAGLSDGLHTLEVGTKDAARNRGKAESYTWLIDSTPPVIDINVPRDGGEYVLGNVVLADWTATDSGSGMGRITSDADNGSAINTSSLGLHSFAVTAEDAVGNATTVTASYHVIRGMEIAVGGGAPGDLKTILDQPIEGEGAEIGGVLLAAVYGFNEPINISFALADNGDPITDVLVTMTLVRLLDPAAEDIAGQEVIIDAAIVPYEPSSASYELTVSAATDTYVLEAGYYDIWLEFDDGSEYRLRIQITEAPGEQP